MTTYSAGENNLIKDETVFQIDSTEGQVILILPVISSYVETGTGSFDKTFTYKWTDKATVKNNYKIKCNSFVTSNKGNGELTIRIRGKYSDSSSWGLSSSLMKK